MKHHLSALYGAVFTASCLLPATSLADDTEVFFAQPLTASQQATNVLFMFDTSGSMTSHDGKPLRRIERLKQAMVDVVSSIEDVSVGIGAFNGTWKGGAILYPARDVSEDVCPNAGCASVEVSSRITSPNDDVEQLPWGPMDLNSNTLELTDVDDTRASITKTYTVKTSEDDAIQDANGTLTLDGGELPMFFAGLASPTMVGVRFADIDIPAGSTVIDARLRFKTVANGSDGDVSAVIYTDPTPSSPPFADVPGARVADRGYSTESSYWGYLPSNNTAKQVVSSNDLDDLVHAKVNEATWNDGDAITFLIETDYYTAASLTDRRTFMSFDAEGPAEAPELEITYTATPKTSQTIGLRFTDLNVPRGATITQAKVEFISSDQDYGAATYTIRGENVGNAAPYGTTDFHLTDRLDTTATVAWTAEDWNSGQGVYQTSDISAVVQEIVNRGDWCGGNAMALTIEGTGFRRAHTRDKGEWDVPVLKVTYDPATVDFNTSCVNQTVSSSVHASVDDAQEEHSSGVVSTGEDTLSTRVGPEKQTLGLRFSQLSVPNNAIVTSAYLQLTSAGGDTNTTDLDITGELIGDSPPFDGTVSSNLTGRTPALQTVTWSDVSTEPAGTVVKSPDISPILSAIVAQPTWAEDNALTLFIQPSGGGSGARAYGSFDGGAAARLIVNYQLEGTVMAGTPPVLRTAREDLIDTMLNFRADGGTPMVDAYYEAAAYMTGQDVQFGKQRGDQGAGERIFRVSSADSLTGGTLYRPPSCLEVDLSNVACAGEQWNGSPVYTAPVPGVCQANQVVLLTDGQATSNSSESLIQSLTGNATCAARSNTQDNCAVEMATWLNSNDHDATQPGMQPVVTHTVGFNTSSDILRDIATEGGGQFFEVESSVQLSNVFKKIINEAADINTSFVAPAATVSQFNRLTNRNDVYFAMFKPDSVTRWDGNLKKYEFNNLTGDPNDTKIVDALGAEAFNSASNGISATARSFWTPPADGADGAEVSKGGAASRLALPRNVLTFEYDTTTGNPGALVAFHESNTAITTDLLGIAGADAGQRERLIQWARGVDVLDYDGDADTTEVRAQMGDPMHSTPFVINYASSAPEGKSVVYVGTNEGYLHAIDTSDGTEKFAMIPPDLIGNLNRFYENLASLDRPYGLDGDISGWVDDVNDNLVVDPGEKAYIFVGMRRGGRNYYALDVSDPDNPSVAWVIRGGEGNFTELGQTWSKPVKTRVKDAGTEKDVLIFAAGYDENNDIRTGRDSSDTMGRGFYIVDAKTGALLSTVSDIDFADLKYAIPSNMRVIDINVDGFADYLFVGDMGGQLWRFDIDNQATGSLDSAISGGVVADFGASNETDNRRFFYEPDVALIRDDLGNQFLTLSIGSGWRAHPLDDQVRDRFYVVRDYAVFGPPRDTSGVIDYPVALQESDLFNATTASASTDTTGRVAKGWYFELGNSGEKVLSSSVTVNSQILFTTYLPEAGSGDACGVSVGGGRAYVVDAVYGDPVLNLDGTGAESDPLALVEDRSVRLNVPGIPPGVSTLLLDMGGTGDNPVGKTFVGIDDGVLPNVDFGKLLKRTFWAEN